MKRLLKEVILRSEEDTYNLARELARHLRGNEVICLRGTLGAGKTTFVKALAKALKVKNPNVVRSPTFTLVNEYETQKGKLIHVDLYRVRDFDYSEFIGEGILAVEWEERDEPCDIILEIEILDEKKRKVRIYTK